MLPGGIEADHRIVLSVEEAGIPTAPVTLVTVDFPPSVSQQEREGVSQTALTIMLPDISPLSDPKDGKAPFKLHTIRFKDWRGDTLREEFPIEGKARFGLNHDNLVFISRDDRRYNPPSEQIEENLLAVAALLGSGQRVPDRSEIWPLLPDGQGSYIDGDLIVLTGSDVELVQEIYRQLVESGYQETEDTWKTAIAKVRESQAIVIS